MLALSWKSLQVPICDIILYLTLLGRYRKAVMVIDGARNQTVLEKGSIEPRLMNASDGGRNREVFFICLFSLNISHRSQCD